jgi:ketosteroid isomerase-like protein
LRADNETRSIINSLLEQYKAAVEAKNADEIVALTTNDPNMLNIGPGKDEMSIGTGQLKEYYQKIFGMADTVTLKYGYTTIKSNGNVAWVSSHLWETLKKGQTRQLLLDMRMTAVAEKIDNKWGFSEMHFSVPTEVKMPEPSPEEKAAEEAALAAAKAAEEAKKKAVEDKKKAEKKADEPPTDQSFFDYY